MDNTIFHSLNEQELITGLKVCTENCQNHFSAANELANIGLYGIANSHLILSSEEGVKALLILLKIMGGDFSKIDISPFFKKHAPKHQAAREFYWDFKFGEYIANLVQEKMLKDAPKYAKNINGKVHFDKIKYQKDFDRNLMLEQRKHKVDLWRSGWDKNDKELKWWNKADYYKNRGFYVNYANSKWEYPHQITKEIFEDSKDIVKNIVTYITKNCNIEALPAIMEYQNFRNMNKIELYNTAPNGTKIDRIEIVEVPNLDGSEEEYQAWHIDFINEDRVLIGTVNLTMGSISFEKTDFVMGIPASSIKLLVEWIEKNIKDEN